MEINGGYSSQYPSYESWQQTEKKKIRQCSNGLGAAFLGYLLVSMVAREACMGIYMLLFPRAGLMGPIPETVEQIFDVIVYVLSLFIPFCIYTAVIQMPLSVALPFRRAKADITFGGIFVGLAFTVVAELFNSVIQMAAMYAGMEFTMPDYSTPESGGTALILYSVSMTVLAAFCEEMVFRGCILQSLRRFGDEFALIVSSLIFGIYHLNLIQMPYAFLVGIVIGFFVMKSGSLWTGILIHLANNGIALVFSFLMDSVSENVYSILFIANNLLEIVFGTVFIIYFLVKYKKFFQLIPGHTTLSSGKKVWYFVSCPILIIAFIIACVIGSSYIQFF